MKNLKFPVIAATALFGAILIAGCPKPQETVVVPQQKVVEKTTVKEVPPKTVIMKPATKTGPKTTVKTDVKVTVAPTPTPLPSPSPAPTPKAQVKNTPTPVAKAKATPTPRPKPVVKPTAKPKPTATPKAVAKADSKKLVVRAEVIATSRVPDPKTVAYKESLVFTKLKVLSVQSGQYKEKEILVAQWGMKDKKLLPPSRNRVGRVMTLSLEPLSSDLESVMRNDDTNETELMPYFAK